jgi:hypothetical protein
MWTNCEHCFFGKKHFSHTFDSTNSFIHKTTKHILILQVILCKTLFRVLKKFNYL